MHSKFLSNVSVNVRQSNHQRYSYQRTKHLQDFPISAYRPTNSSEPSLSWSLTERKFDTSAVRTQLGSRPESNENRGVLDLDMDELNKVLRTYSGQWNPHFNCSLGIIFMPQIQNAFTN